MACRSGCLTKDHDSWGDCLRAANIQMNAGDAKHTVGMSRKKWDGELEAYRSAREQGVQPAGTSQSQIDAAMSASETLGRAYDAGTMPRAASINETSAKALNYIETGKES